MSLSKLSEKCRKCDFVKTCNVKQMEAVGFLCDETVNPLIICEIESFERDRNQEWMKANPALAPYSPRMFYRTLDTSISEADEKMVKGWVQLIEKPYTDSSKVAIVSNVKNMHPDDKFMAAVSGVQTMNDLGMPVAIKKVTVLVDGTRIEIPEEQYLKMLDDCLRISLTSMMDEVDKSLLNGTGTGSPIGLTTPASCMNSSDLKDPSPYQINPVEIKSFEDSLYKSLGVSQNFFNSSVCSCNYGIPYADENLLSPHDPRYIEGGDNRVYADKEWRK